MTSITTRDIPALEPHCNSWVVVRRDNGEPVAEFHARADRRPAKSLYNFRADRVVILTAAQWLGAVNRSLAPCKP